MRHWPDTLPNPLGPGYEMTPADPFLRTDMEVGPARQRRLTSARMDRVQAVWQFSPLEFTAFRAWFEDADWSLAGDSDDLSTWTRQGVTWAPGQSLVPVTAMAAGRMLETATSGEHGHSRAVPGLTSGATAHVTLSARAAGRSLLRVTLTGRDGTVRACDIDLATASVAWAGGATTAQVQDRGDGWVRILLTVPAGIGPSAATLRLSLLQAPGVTSYTGNPAAGVDLAEVNLRSEAGLYLPTGSDGRARGLAGGGAWAFVPVWTGGVFKPQETRLEGMFSVELLPGLNTRVSAPLEVRLA